MTPVSTLLLLALASLLLAPGFGSYRTDNNSASNPQKNTRFIVKTVSFQNDPELEKCRVTSSQLESQNNDCQQKLSKWQAAVSVFSSSLEPELLEAAKAGNESQVSEYLDMGVNPSTSDGKGYTPLHWAAWYGYVKIVLDLVRAGASIEARDNQKQTPLHWASYGPSSAAVQPLLDSGADINALDKWEWTPLHWAAYEGRPDAARVLVDNGANTTIKGYKGRTALEVAEYYQKSDVVEILSG